MKKSLTLVDAWFFLLELSTWGAPLAPKLTQGQAADLNPGSGLPPLSRGIKLGGLPVLSNRDSHVFWGLKSRISTTQRHVTRNLWAGVLSCEASA